MQRTLSNSFDWVLVGAGLFNLLLALRLKEARQSFIVLERRKLPELNKTWSFHLSDLSESQWQWLKPFVRHTWTKQEVWFSTFRRTLEQPYCSLRAQEFVPDVWQRIGIESILGACEVSEVEATRVVTNLGEFFGRRVIDTRGWQRPEASGSGFQKFMGWDVRFSVPHGVSAPVIMDAQVRQKDGYRFVYLLPWSSTELLIEDTRYSLDSHLHEDRLREDLQHYIQWRWPQSAHIKEREETGCLPIPLSRRARLDYEFGVRGGFFHPTTSYSLPWALRVGELLVETPLTDESHRRLAKLAPDSFYFLLNRLLFLAALPEERWKIFAKFYRLPEDVIQRFYGGRSTILDKARIFSGRPPVRLGRALAAIGNSWQRENHGVV